MEILSTQERDQASQSVAGNASVRSLSSPHCLSASPARSFSETRCLVVGPQLGTYGGRGSEMAGPQVPNPPSAMRTCASQGKGVCSRGLKHWVSRCNFRWKHRSSMATELTPTKANRPLARSILAQAAKQDAYDVPAWAMCGSRITEKAWRTTVVLQRVPQVEVGGGQIDR